MLSGFNTNVPYRGEIFHVQTENGGTRYPFVTSFLYHRGAILHSKKTKYSELLDEDGWESKLVDIMMEQHRGVISDLEDGRLKEVEDMVVVEEEHAVEQEPDAAEEKNDLDSIIMEYIFSDGD
jgi:hypothetical protein